MADYIFDDWKKILEDFQNSVSKDLEEIHKQKNEVQQMKSDIFDRLSEAVTSTWRVPARWAPSASAHHSSSRPP